MKSLANSSNWGGFDFDEFVAWLATMEPNSRATMTRPGRQMLVKFWITALFGLGLLTGCVTNRDKTPPHTIPKIDFHQHFKDDLDIEDYLRVMDEYHVEKSVLLALKSPKNDYKDQNKLVMEMYRRFPKRIVPFITFVENDPQGIQIVKRLHKQGARGIKFIGWLSRQVDRYDFDLTSEHLMKVYEYCAKHGLIVLFHVDFRKHEKGYHLKMEKILRRFPELRVVVAHGGIDLRHMARFEEHLKHPHFYIDLSFYGTYKEYWFAQVSKYRKTLRSMILKFPRQFLWATDLFPSGQKDVQYLRDVVQGSVDLVEKSRYVRPEFKHLNRGHGLGLPKKVLEMIYYTNAKRLLDPSGISRVSP